MKSSHLTMVSGMLLLSLVVLFASGLLLDAITTQYKAWLHSTDTTIAPAARWLFVASNEGKLAYLQVTLWLWWPMVFSYFDLLIRQQHDKDALATFALMFGVCWLCVAVFVCGWLFLLVVPHTPAGLRPLQSTLAHSNLILIVSWALPLVTALASGWRWWRRRGRGPRKEGL